MKAVQAHWQAHSAMEDVIQKQELYVKHLRLCLLL
jgi:hypothetical protein